MERKENKRNEMRARIGKPLTDRDINDASLRASQRENARAYIETIIIAVGKISVSQIKTICSLRMDVENIYPSTEQ